MVERQQKRACCCVALGDIEVEGEGIQHAEGKIPGPLGGILDKKTVCKSVDQGAFDGPGNFDDLDDDKPGYGPQPDQKGEIACHLRRREAAHPQPARPDC